MLLVATVLGSWAFHGAPEGGANAGVGTSDTANAELARTALYSPYVLEMRSSLPFDVISFKDVGMSLPMAERDAVYESLATQLSAELASATAPMSSVVMHSESAADPAQHLFCEGRHIYVDLWQESGGDWGYSLWSGCTADHEFERGGVSRQDELFASLEPLADSIADDLRQAVETRCFTRAC